MKNNVLIRTKWLQFPCSICVELKIARMGESSGQASELLISLRRVLALLNDTCITRCLNDEELLGHMYDGARMAFDANCTDLGRLESPRVLWSSKPHYAVLVSVLKGEALDVPLCNARNSG
jgi:hypothetical protein